MPRTDPARTDARTRIRQREMLTYSARANPVIHGDNNPMSEFVNTSRPTQVSASARRWKVRLKVGDEVLTYSVINLSSHHSLPTFPHFSASEFVNNHADGLMTYLTHSSRHPTRARSAATQTLREHFGGSCGRVDGASPRSGPSGACCLAALWAHGGTCQRVAAVPARVSRDCQAVLGAEAGPGESCEQEHKAPGWEAECGDGWTARLKGLESPCPPRFEAIERILYATCKPAKGLRVGLLPWKHLPTDPKASAFSNKIKDVADAHEPQSRSPNQRYEHQDCGEGAGRRTWPAQPDQHPLGQESHAPGAYREASRWHSSASFTGPPGGKRANNPTGSTCIAGSPFLGRA